MIEQAADAMAEDPRVRDALIIGAGFSGLYQLHQLRDELGLDVLVVEAGSDVGGTWYWNRYPGARCDSESYAYCFSFDPQLEQQWNWTERYPGAAEIRSYLGHVADRYALRRNILFDTKVEGARFDDATGNWVVVTQAGRTYRARFLITAVGCLSSANVPDIPGLDDFAGEWYHTGQWPHAGVDFSGKRVGLIGTGSTGIQVTPEVARQAEHLHVFQRTANYSVPARNRPLQPGESDAIKASYAQIRRTMRSNTNGHPYVISELSALELPEQERLDRYEAAWNLGGLGFRATFKDLLTSLEANETASEFIRSKIRSIVKDPETAERLVPKDHPFASKRPPIDSGYFETFNRPNVSLVDVRAAPIVAITQKGIRTTAAEYELDAIIFATGFDAMTGPLLKLNITGSGGRSLREDWAGGPCTLLGVQIPGYPNLFTVTGPGSPAVLCNMPVAIEQHTQWITACIRHLLETGHRRIEADAHAAARWMEQVDEASRKTLLPLANHSWYLGANIPGKPRVFMPYAGGMANFARISDQIARDGYRGFRLN